MLEVFRGIAAAPAGFGPSVAAIGNFDGVHLGHQAILRRAVEAARAEGAAAVAVTFDPHPAKILKPASAPPLMTTVERRLERFAELGIDAALIIAFDREFAGQTPDEFAARVLVGALRARRVVVGENFRFGAGGRGDIGTLERLGAELGFLADAVAPVLVGGEPVSSTRIRRAAAAGRMNAVRRLLGEPFRTRGIVVRGRGIGSRETAPTLNLEPEAELLPADGVYVSRALDPLGGGAWRSVTNIGIRPTFGGGPRTVETHLLEPLGGDPPKSLEIEFYRRLRGERKFESAQALKRQILADVARTRRYFSRADLLGVKSSV